jgi:signal transduction histidine kinase
MRSLFAKILVWFVLALTATGAAFFVISALVVSETRSRHFPMGQLLRVQAREARHAWETGGRKALADTLARFAEGAPVRGFLTDLQGRDLVSERDLSDMVKDLEASGGRPALRGDRMLFGRQTEDGRYWFFLEVPRRRFLEPLLHPVYLWVLGVVVLACWAMARHLTAPLRELRATVEAFGQGNLSVRVRSRRKDEIGDLARHFDRMADRIESLLASEKQLLADISHELRSPLARLNLAIELARSGENREAAMDRIQRESERLSQLVEELLQVTRVEADPSALHQDTIQLERLLGAIVEDSVLEAGARKVSVRLDCSEPVAMNGDPELLRRAVENVLRNAIRHTPAGSTVTVRLEANPARVLIAVEDEGPGVPEKDLQKIFDPFYRVEPDRARASGGAGLGLAIARRAVELHNGAIRARNTGRGLRVEIEFLR